MIRTSRKVAKSQRVGFPKTMTKRHAARIARSSVRAACSEDIGLTTQPTNTETFIKQLQFTFNSLIANCFGHSLGIPHSHFHAVTVAFPAVSPINQ